MNNSKPSHSCRIKIMENGSYSVSGKPNMVEMERVTNAEGEAIDWKYGKEFETKEKFSLCRCGHSKNKPFCDATHKTIPFDGALTADRAPREPREKVYEGFDIDMTDDESLCAGYAFCDRYGSVWEEINDSAIPEVRKRIEKQVALCPSGRLEYYLKNKKEPEEVHYEPTIGVIKDGPLLALGNIPVEAPDGFVYEVRNRQLLCRCGESKNKPFCDGAHWDIEFKAD